MQLLAGHPKRGLLHIPQAESRLRIQADWDFSKPNFVYGLPAGQTRGKSKREGDAGRYHRNHPQRETQVVPAEGYKTQSPFLPQETDALPVVGPDSSLTATINAGLPPSGTGGA